MREAYVREGGVGDIAHLRNAGGAAVDLDPSGGVTVTCPGAGTFHVDAETAEMIATALARMQGSGGSRVDVGNGIMLFTGGVLQLAGASLAEHGAVGAPQCAAIPDATDEASAVTAVNALMAYFRLRGTMASTP